MIITFIFIAGCAYNDIQYLPNTVTLTVRVISLCVLIVWGFIHQLQATKRYYRTAHAPFTSLHKLIWGRDYFTAIRLFCSRYLLMQAEKENIWMHLLCISKTFAHFNLDCDSWTLLPWGLKTQHFTNYCH